MKKTLSILLAVMLLLTLAPLNAFAADDGIQVTVNGQAVAFPDAKPFVNADNRTLTPLSPIAQAMDLEVAWDGTQKIATFTKLYTPETAPLVDSPDDTHTGTYYLGKETVAFTIGSKEAVYTISFYDSTDTERTTPIESKTVTKKIVMDTEAIVKENRTFAPVKYLAETLGYAVDWDGMTKMVGLYSRASLADLDLLGLDSDRCALAFFKGHLAEIGNLTEMKIKSATVDGKAAEYKEFTQQELDDSELEFDGYLDGGRISYSFENGKVYKIALTYDLTMDGQTREGEYTYNLNVDGYGGPM